MRTAVAMALGVVMTAALPASAQDLGGYMTTGSGSIDYLVTREAIPQISGGVLVGFADDRVRVGAQADVFFSNGYVSGRGGPLVEVRVVPKRTRVQPFATGGCYFGEDGAMLMLGGGLDVWMTGTVGIRAVVQDAVRQSRFSGPFRPPRTTFHEPAALVGVVWR